MLVSCYPKEQQLVMLLTTTHDRPVLDNAKKKTGTNEKRCDVDILNRMLPENGSQPKYDNSKICEFTFRMERNKNVNVNRCNVTICSKLIHCAILPVLKVTCRKDVIYVVTIQS